MKELNNFQKKFFDCLSEIQETTVAIAMCKYKEGDDIENLLYDVTWETIIEMMTLIDGYGNFRDGKLAVTNPKTGENLKEAPYIELHDWVCEYLKFEKFPSELDGATVLEYSCVGDFGTIEGDNRKVRYMAICQYEGEERYYLFYCAACEGKYDVMQDVLLDSVEECKEVAAQRGAVVWQKRIN